MNAAPREFTLVPFWFWNDELDKAELLRQIADFDTHGVHGFVIHPRIGLPRSLGWMSPGLLRFMRLAIEEAARREMIVVLYDEGMYPSGSSSGQVVAANPAFRCRGLKLADAAGLAPGENLVATVRRRNGETVTIVDAPSPTSVIRGLHYLDEATGAEECPPAADLLNPDAVACFIRLVYERYHAEFGAHFGKTIPAIFTDEPMLLGRCRSREFRPGTTGILAHVNRLLGYDFTPHLPALWFDDEPDAARYRTDYRRALRRRLEETFYRPLHDWCAAHGVALCGHPDGDDQIGLLRHFQWPGMDLVWRYVEPDKPTALEGEHSTMAKCSASAMLHHGRRRNLNEFAGAYGHELTFAEMKWLADWCLVRGVNLLIPHAFYYSTRGPRRDERPPDVGPNSPWWPDYRRFADYCRWLCWLNTDSRQVCDVAILGESDFLPWRAAEVCFQHQRDFNYLERRDLDQPVAQRYRALIAEEDTPVPDAGHDRLVRWQPGMPAAEFLAALEQLAPADLRVTPAQPNLRYRHVAKDGVDYYLLFNEGREPLHCDVELAARGAVTLLDLFGGTEEPYAPDRVVAFGPYETRVLRIRPIRCVWRR